MAAAAGDCAYEQTEAQEKALRDEANAALPVGPLEPLGNLAAEFESGSVFEVKVKNLPFTQIRRTRRDGNCFYRSFLFGVYKSVAKDLTFRKSCLDQITKDALPFVLSAGYDKFAIEDMFTEFVEGFAMFYSTPPAFKDEGGLDDEKPGERKEAVISDEEVERLFQSDDMNYQICFLRAVTSSFMKHNADQFQPFMVDTTVAQFCATEVDPMWREADELQIQALTGYFKGLGVNIWYLDQSEGDSCTCHRMNEGAAPAIDVLYRPGHYELVF